MPARFLCGNVVRKIFHRHALACVGFVVGAGAGQLDVTYEAVVDYDALSAVLAGSLGLVDVDVVDEFPQERRGQAVHLGNYSNDRKSAERNCADRMGEHMNRFSAEFRQLEVPGLYKYYSTQRPVDIGTFPKPRDNQPDKIVNFDWRVPVEGDAFLFWDCPTYTKPLARKEAAEQARLENRPAPEKKPECEEH